MNTRISMTVFSTVAIVVGTLLAIKYAQGYRPTSQGTLKATGLLAANSFPNGASIFIDGKLTSATDTTINLEPGTYTISIKKEGYASWEKVLRIEKELVTQTNAVLFPSAPSLTPLTFTGVSHVTISPDGNSLAYYNATVSGSNSATLTLLQLTDSPLSFGRSSRQIAVTKNPSLLADTKILWSPELDEILLLTQKRAYILPLDETTDLDSAPDSSAKVSATIAAWDAVAQKKRNAALALFPESVAAIATTSAQTILISPDQKRIMYTATASAQIPQDLLPKVPAASTQQEERVLRPGNTYVYDRSEDKNFLVYAQNTVATPTPKASPKTKVTAPLPTLIQSAAPSLQWHPDSKHIIVMTANTIESIEYDGTNKTQLYAGPFEKDFLAIWPNGNKLVIQTTLNGQDRSQSNLYAVGIR